MFFQPFYISRVFINESFQGVKQMVQKQAERIIAQYLKPIYGFALKRCISLQDAQDLAQEIAFKVFRALLIRDDIENVEKYIWTAAHNALANYYRDKTKRAIGIPIDELAETLPFDNESISADEKELIERLHTEIAYLSKLQRRIVIAYYYENRQQEAIAKELGIPLGTVKWHLFEAKKELKEGMSSMREAGELKFNPIRFSMCGFSGSTGTKGGVESFLRSSLAQNIAYCVSKEAKTINEIAAALGVSPVYVESEAEYLEEYGFLIKKNNKYLINFLLEEGNEEIAAIMNNMYQQAAKRFANELFDALADSPVLEDDNMFCFNRMEGIDEIEKVPIFKKDKNFMLWALIPYIAALSGEELRDRRISFEEACTIRPDGGQNICYASIEGGHEPMYFDSMLKFCGPCWNGFADKFILWTIDTEWSRRRVDENYQLRVRQDLAILERFLKGEELSEYEMAYMYEKGYLRRYSSEKGAWTALQIGWIRNEEANKTILAYGDRIKEKCKAEFDAAKAPYVKAVLDATPKHLHKMKMFGLQYVFYSDAWFILHCMKELVNNGKLKPPTDEQKKSLTTLIAPSK